MELKKPMNNAKEENAAHTDADSTRPTDHVVSDLQEFHLHVLRNDDAMDSVFADQLSSNKTPRRSASPLLEFKVFATSPPESANKSFCFHL